ncbi:MAG: mechanosensitive ion channel domain-containing protein [Polyangiaceae bacterium]
MHERTPTLLAMALAEANPFGLGDTAWLWVQRGIKAMVVILVGILLLRLVPLLERLVLRLSTRHGEQGPDGERKSATVTAIQMQRRTETLTRVTGSVARAIIWAVTLIVTLGNVGLDIAPLIAGAGVAGVAVGFGAQSIVKDFFAGFFILLEGQFEIGDQITVAGVSGTVERMTMRITVLRDTTTGAAHFIPNSSITLVANKTEGWSGASVDAVFGTNVAEDRIREALGEAARLATQEMRKARVLLEDVRVEGPVEFNTAGITWRLASKVRPDRVPEARRVLISVVSRVLQHRSFGKRGGALVVKPTGAATTSDVVDQAGAAAPGAPPPPGDVSLDTTVRTADPGTPKA